MTTHTRLEAVVERVNLSPDSWDQHYRSQGIDSLDFIELVLETEREFNITIQDKEVAQVNTLNDLHRLVDSKVNPYGQSSI